MRQIVASSGVRISNAGRRDHRVTARDPAVPLSTLWTMGSPSQFAMTSRGACFVTPSCIQGGRFKLPPLPWDGVALSYPTDTTICRTGAVVANCDNGEAHPLVGSPKFGRARNPGTEKTRSPPGVTISVTPLYPRPHCHGLRVSVPQRLGREC